MRTSPTPIPKRNDFSGRRILVVEDDYVLARDMCRDLRRCGATVLGPAPTTHYAFNLLLGPRGLDGAVLDVRLHGQHVFELATRLRELGVPMLFATGYEQDIPADFSAEPRMCKPLHSDELIDKVANLMVPARAKAAPAAPVMLDVEKPANDGLEARLARSVSRALQQALIRA